MINLASEQSDTDAADCSKLITVFRVDASLIIGTGHVSRCLALADILKLRGCRCSFICRDLPGNSIEAIRASGFEVDVLPSPVKPPPGSGRTYDQWAEVQWQQDANETKRVLAEREPNWLVLDHYAFDKKWEPAENLIHHSDRGNQYVSIKYTEQLVDARLEPSVGSVGDSYDNALAETVIGLFKTEVINRFRQLHDGG